MSFDVRKTDLTKLNSITKYPAIPTYHTLDPKNGGLLEAAVQFEGMVLGTEKIDGTNARIICLPDRNFILGSREELLYGRGDLISNPALGIVAAIKGVAERLIDSAAQEGIQVFYLEVFGGKVTAASKQYTGTQQVSYRLFDLMPLPDYEPLLAKESQEIAQWREGGGQPFVDEDGLQAAAEKHQLALTPRLCSLSATELPRSVSGMSDFLKERLPASQSILDAEAGGLAEGIVWRTSSRSVIAKARSEDYARTMKRRGNQR